MGRGVRPRPCRPRPRPRRASWPPARPSATPGCARSSTSWGSCATPGRLRPMRKAGSTTRTHRRDLLRDIVAITAAAGRRRPRPAPRLWRTRVEQRATPPRGCGRSNRPSPETPTRSQRALKAEWEAQRQPARDAAQTVRHGSGRLGQRRGAVREAREHLEGWAQTWRPYLPAMPADPDQVVSFAAWFDDTPRHHQSFDAYARTAAEHAHPDYLPARDAAQDASQAKTVAWQELREAEQHYSMALQHHGILGTVDDPHAYLADVDQAIAVDTAELAKARNQIIRAACRTDPARAPGRRRQHRPRPVDPESRTACLVASRSRRRRARRGPRSRAT